MNQAALRNERSQHNDIPIPLPPSIIIIANLETAVKSPFLLYRLQDEKKINLYAITLLSVCYVCWLSACICRVDPAHYLVGIVSIPDILISVERSKDGGILKIEASVTIEINPIISTTTYLTIGV